MEHPETTIHGPFSYCRASVDGYLVPGVEIHPLTGANDGSANVVVGSFCVLAESSELRKWIPLLAHAMARASGFTCHGENSERANPHKVQLFQIDSQEGLGEQ